jgi:hypothetical protein
MLLETLRKAGVDVERYMTSEEELYPKSTSPQIPEVFRSTTHYTERPRVSEERLYDFFFGRDMYRVFPVIEGGYAIFKVEKDGLSLRRVDGRNHYKHRQNAYRRVRVLNTQYAMDGAKNG